MQFIKKLSFVVWTLLNAQNLALKLNAQFFDIFGKFLRGVGSYSFYMDFNVLQNITIAFSSLALLPVKEIGIGNTRYSISELRRNCRAAILWLRNDEHVWQSDKKFAPRKEGGPECQACSPANPRGKGRWLKGRFDILYPLNDKTLEQFSILLPFKIEVT